MRKIVFFFFFLGLSIVLIWAFSNSQNNIKIDAKISDHLALKVDSAYAFCKKNKMDTTVCVLIDMKIHSGKNRMFVWNFQKDSLIRSGLCCHGAGEGSTGATPVFSNVEGSYCTSLGKYKIGAKAYSKWGIHVHYKLYGLDKTNSNAFKRIVVLHSHTPVPDSEIYPVHLPMGWSLGCPVVSNNMMTLLDELIQESNRPILLWIYY